MKRTICALLAALVGVFAFTGATILNGRVDTHAVDVAHAVPVTASAGQLVTDAAADTQPVPHAAHFSALVSAAAIAALDDAETAEDAAANNSDLKQAETKKVETKEVKEEEPAQEEKKAKESAAEAPVSASTTGVEALGIVSGTGVRMRGGPGTGYSVLMTMSQNAAVAITGKDGNWYKVLYDGTSGYISGDYVTRHDSASGLSYTGRVTADTLNIRSAPGSGSSAVGSVQRGAYVTVTGIEKGWYAVSYNGVSGYVSGDYVALCAAAGTVTETPAEAPVETPAETPAEEAPAVTETVSGTVSGSSVVALAQQYLGTPYVYGGSSASGFDCSGFTMYIYKQFGYNLPHSATSQWLSGMGTKIYSISELQPGDLVFFNDPSRNKGKACSHAGIYIGNGQHVHASSSRNGGVITSDLTSGYYNTYFVGGLRLS